MQELIIFIIVALLLLYWWNSAGAYEVAINAARKKCFQHGLTLLDDTLQTTKLRPCRHADGYMQLCRSYQFEFISDGEQRYKGMIKLAGNQLQNIEMEVYRQDSSVN